jgi:hypothetical protein
VFAVSGLAAFYPLYRGMDVISVAVRADSYRQVEFVIEEVVRDGDPPALWADGRIEPGGQRHRHGTSRAANGDLVLHDDPAVPAVPGRSARIWWSDERLAQTPSLASMP